MRVALGDQQRIVDLVVRIGKQHLLQALRRHVHAGGNHVKAAGDQAGNQAAPFGQHRIDFLDAHLVEHYLGDLRRFAGHTTVRKCVCEWRLVGVTDADFTRALHSFERGFGMGIQGSGDG